MSSFEGVGIIAFSFGQRAKEPSVINRKLAGIVKRIAAELAWNSTRWFAAAQWEVALQMEADGPVADCTIGLPKGEDYIDTQYVLSQGLAFLRERGVSKVILVAHPLHLFVIKLFIKLGLWNTDGFTFIDYPMGSVGFDSSKENTQWWTRSWWQFLTYLVAMTLKLKRRGDRAKA